MITAGPVSVGGGPGAITAGPAPVGGGELVVVGHASAPMTSVHSKVTSQMSRRLMAVTNAWHASDCEGVRWSASDRWSHKATSVDPDTVARTPAIPTRHGVRAGSRLPMVRDQPYCRRARQQSRRRPTEQLCCRTRRTESTHDRRPPPSGEAWVLAFRSQVDLRGSLEQLTRWQHGSYRRVIVASFDGRDSLQW